MDENVEFGEYSSQDDSPPIESWLQLIEQYADAFKIPLSDLDKILDMPIIVFWGTIHYRGVRVSRQNAEQQRKAAYDEFKSRHH